MPFERAELERRLEAAALLRAQLRRATLELRETGRRALAERERGSRRPHGGRPRRR